jgi:hypothetical protein
MMADSLFSVTMKDGTIHENLTYDETSVYMVPGQWEHVRRMEYAKEMDPAKEERWKESRRKEWMSK